MSANIANHLRHVYFGGNWTVTNIQELLADVTWIEATTKVHSFNTIAVLLYHINYFVEVQTKVMEGGPLEGNDAESFDHPPISSEEDWQKMVEDALGGAKRLADMIAEFPDEKLWDGFFEEKYGNYYRNFQGMIEHTHYHLGQISLIKKIIREG